MSAHKLPREWLSAPFRVADPGTAGTYNLDNKGRALCPVTSTTTETRTIPAPDATGQECMVYFDTDGGDVTVTITGGQGISSVVLDDAGDAFKLESVSVAGTAKWIPAWSNGPLSGFPQAMGEISAASVTGTDSSLDIAGKAAAQGGAIVVTGGASSTATNAGGAVSLLGGTGNTSGAGGAINITGGTGGATGVGGQVNITGGTPIAAAGGAVVMAGGAGVGTNKAGGLISVTGGAAAGAAIGGVASLVGGLGGTGGATGKGGAALVTGGASAATNADGGGVVLGGGAKNGTAFVGPIVLGNAQLTPIWYPQAAPAADGADTPITMTVAQMVAGIVSMTPTTGRAVTTPTGAELDAGVAFADVPATFGFDFSVQNRAAFAATDDILTLTAGASGVTVTGSAVVSPGSTARFRAVRTTTATWIIYKIAG